MTRAADAEPLISSSREYIEHHESSDADEAAEEGVAESDLAAPGVFIWVLTFCAGVSGLLFGYEFVHAFRSWCSPSTRSISL